MQWAACRLAKQRRSCCWLPPRGPVEQQLHHGGRPHPLLHSALEVGGGTGMGRGARVGVGLLTGERNRSARLVLLADMRQGVCPSALVGEESSMRCIHANLPLSLCLACLLRPLPGSVGAARGGGLERPPPGSSRCGVVHPGRNAGPGDVITGAWQKGRRQGRGT